MGAVGLLAASEIRRRWRSTVAIALLVGVVGAIVLATVAGARRSGSALERFNAESRSSDIEVDIGVRPGPKLAEFVWTPGIVAMAHLRAYVLDLSQFEQLGADNDLAIAAPLDRVMGDRLDRSRIITGRRADPSASEEITIGESLAELLELHVGSRLELPTFTQDQIHLAFSGSYPGPPAGPTIPFRIVGIDRRPLDLGVRSTAGGVIIMSPEFAPKWDDRIGAFTDVLRIKTSGDGADHAVKFAEAARRLFGEDVTFGFENLGIETEGAKNAINVLTLALWSIAGVTALAGLVAIAIVLTRDIAHQPLDQPTLSALGLSRSQRIRVNAPRALIIAIGGALVAVLGAVLLSPRFPIGVARRADPDPGFHLDWTVLVPAVAILIVIVLAIALLAAVRATRHSSAQTAPRPYRRASTIVERAARAGVRPTATNGLRMAIQSGRGETAVPIRSAFVGAVFGVAGVTAALVFAASLGHLVATPELFGWTFDVTGTVPVERICVDREDFGLSGVPGVKAVAEVCRTNSTVDVDGRPAAAYAFRPLTGTIDPEIIAGRAPRGPREVALGAVTMSALDKGIGDTVRVRGDEEADDYEIVGRVVLPAISGPQPLADGIAVSASGFRTLQGGEGSNETHILVATVRPGVDRAETARSIAALRFQYQGGPNGFRDVATAAVPVEVSRLQQIDRVPAWIAALLGTLALIAVGYAAVTAVRRRRHEVAILKILGFSRGQVRATVAWQASILAGVGLGFGIPLGVIVGRAIWHLIARGLGVSTIVSLPWLALFILVPCTFLVVNLMAYFPGRSASRTRPAVALREE